MSTVSGYSDTMAALFQNRPLPNREEAVGPAESSLFSKGEDVGRIPQETVAQVFHSERNGVPDSFQPGKDEINVSARPQWMKSGLDSLVDAQVISEEQRDAVFAALKQDGVNPLEELVADGLLTEDQKDAILSSFRDNVKMRHARQAYNLMRTLPPDLLAPSDAETDLLSGITT